MMSTAAAAPHNAYVAPRGCYTSSRGLRSVQTAGVRLTSRGRAVLLVLFVGLAFALISMLGGHSAATGEAGRPVPTRTIVVSEGDTLWDIASGLAEPGETREMIHYIEELNALSSPSLMEGQRLAVPVSSGE